MLPHDAITPWHYRVAAREHERHRDEARRHAHRRATLEARPARPPRPSPLARLRAAIPSRGAEDHGLTDYPCRLPDGTIGRVSVIEVDGEWTMVCRVAPNAGVAGDRLVQEPV
jgi:hypothetical protein